MIALVGTVLAASLLGSPHCAAMCGPLTCLYTGDAGARKTGPHLAYNLGRLASYLLLGALAGLAGSGMNQLGVLAGVPRVAAIVAGCLMVLWGGLTIAAALGVSVPGTSPPPVFRRMLARVVTRFQRHPPALRAGALGLLTTLLPCGWLYAFVATAAGTGSMPSGMLVMTAFWAGTVPIMAVVGLTAQRALGPLRRRLPVVTAAALVVIGLLTISGRITMASVPPGAGSHVVH
ncbi:MAG: sulfite exporter TauE/SafE family protein [Gemmatimonadota bacterium]|nr:sulfite exporter TauE/SafE family protein [Gemmatimonadota bacterium]